MPIACTSLALAPRRASAPAITSPRARPDLERVVLHPAGARADLLVLALLERGDLPVAVEQDEAGAGSPLVDRSDVAWHRGERV